jgi:hypothetical protein
VASIQKPWDEPGAISRPFRSHLGSRMDSPNAPRSLVGAARQHPRITVHDISYYPQALLTQQL